MRRAIIIDQNKCLGCQACTVACKDWNQVEPGPVKWRKATIYETDQGPVFSPISMGCNHCAVPACVDSCGSGAITKRGSDGIVYIDREKCIGLLSCITACPFNKPQIADDIQEPYRYLGWQTRHPAQKCNFCMDRIDVGQAPSCVRACPSFALEMGDYDALQAKYLAQGKDVAPLSFGEFPYAYKPGGKTDTEPSLLIVKRKPLTYVEDV